MTTTLQQTTAHGTDAFAEARELEWMWKTEPMMRMALALVALALAQDEFAADDLPAELDHGGTGIAGSIMATLVNQGLIKRAGLWRNEEFFGKERASKRAGRKDAKLKVFACADRAKCETFLKGKHHFKELRQPELAELCQGNVGQGNESFSYSSDTNSPD